jgi:transposase
MDGQPFALFMDNLMVHRSKLSLDCYAELKIPVIFNVVYSPEFNPIEGCFSIVKNFYKR